MPISDEIIELAPVKKTKTIMIIMFAVMGALLALAVTFLVMYLIKPSFEEITGRIVGVVEDSSSLYQSSTSSGEPAKFASVGNEYTVKVTVAAEGDADPGVIWMVEPAGAVEDKGKGVLSSDETGKTFFFKFVPLSEYADGTTPITITARSLHDVDQLARIKFYAVKQGTEEIRLSKYWTSKNTNGISITDGEVLRLPYYSSRMNNPVFYMSYEQFGANNGDSDVYSPLTKVTGTDGVHSTTMVSVTTPNTDVIEIGDVLDSDDVPKFTFKILKAGATATINITANVNNDFAEPVTKIVTINTVSNSELGYIDAIRVYSDPLTTAFYEANKNNQANLPRSAESITLPYGSNYKNILKHIALSPFSLQYNGTAMTPVTDWADKLEIVSSDNEVARYVNGSLVIGRFADTRDCEITVRDRTASSLGAEVKLTVKVVAHNPSGSISVTTPSQSYTEAALEAMAVTTGINTSQGGTVGMTIEYAITAPATTQREKIVSLLSNGYKLSVKKNGADAPGVMSVKLANLGYDNGKAVVENYSNNVTVGKASAFTDKTLCVIPGRGDSFTAVAMFQIAVNTSNVSDGLYTIEFEKIGVDLAGEDNNINLRNRSWKKSFRLNVTEKPSKAVFISADEAIDLISPNKLNAGKFTVTRVPQLTTNNNQTYWSGAAAVYIQNRAAADFPFELSRLIALLNADGVKLNSQNGNIGVNVTRVATSGILSKNDSSTNVRFTGKALNASNSQGPHAEAVVTASDSAGKKIGQFDIAIYVIDAIEMLYCEDTAERVISYSGTTFARFEKDTVKATVKHSETSGNYNCNDFDIEYGDGNKLVGAWDTPDGKYAYGAGKKTFKIGNDIIFEYVKSTGNITAKCDLFEYSYNHVGIDLSDIRVVYTLNEEDRYFGEDMTCGRDYKFERAADGVGLFGDSTFAPGVALIDTTDESKRTCSFNQGSLVNLISSPIVKIGGGTKIVTRYAAASGKTVAAVRNVYFTVPGGITLQGSTELVVGSGHYTAVSFRAPDVVSTVEPVDKYTFTAYTNSGINFEVRIENYARPIDENGIGIYSDEECTTPLTALQFGKLTASTESPYAKPFWLKITYGDKGRYNKFEPAVIHNLPNFFIVTDSEGTRIERLEFAADNKLLNNDTVEFKSKKFYLKLLGTATDLESLTVDIREAFPGVSQPITASFTVTVRTGLESIALDVDGKTEIARVSTVTASDIIYKFKFDDAADVIGDNATLRIPLSFNTLAAAQSSDGTYPDIKFDFRNDLTATVTSVNGLNIDVTHINDTAPYISVSVNSETFIAGTEYAFTVTFTDTESSTSFTAKFKVSVAVDIFKIDATPAAPVLHITGNSTGEQSVSVSLQYNNGQSKYAPESAYLENVDVLVVSKVGNVVAENPAKFRVVKVNSGNYMLYVKNDASGDNYYLRVKYKSIINDYKITLNTQETNIRVTASNISESGVAVVAVSSAEQEFDISAEVYKIGDGSAVPSLASSVTYKLYSDAAHSTEIPSTVATSVGGKLKFVAPVSRTGRIYAVASYTDAQSGKARAINTVVDYAVTISSVSLGADKFGAGDKTFTAGTSGSADTITLYRLDANNYSRIDLTPYIVTAAPFGMIIPSADIAKTVSVTGALSASGLLIAPTGVGTGTVTITAKHGNNAPVTYTCNVVVRGFEDLDNALSLDTTRLDIVGDDSATLSASSLSEYDGITRTYSVAVSNNADGRISLATTGLSSAVSLDRSKFTSQSCYGDYILTSTLTYVVPTAWSAKTVGEFKMTATRTFTVVFDYTLDFKLVKSKSGTDTDVQASTTHTADPDAQYKAVITSAFYSDDWTYSLSSNNDMVAAAAFTSNSAVLSGLNVKSGTFTLTVTASAYGKTLAKSYSYTFASERSISAALTANNGTLSFTDNGATKEATLDIGYAASSTPSQPWTFTYTVNTSEPIENVDIVWSGDVVAGTKTKSGNTVFMTFTADKPTRFLVNGTVVCNGITYYTQKYKLELTATEPQFALSATADSIRPLGESTLSVSNATAASAFKGAYSVSYSMIAGGDIAPVTSGGVVTANASNTVGGKAVVCAEIRVTSGVYSGRVYKLYKEITVVGIPLPTAAFANAQTECAVGSSLTLSDVLECTTTVQASDESSYTYASGNISYDYNAESTYFVKGVDYTLNNGVLGILDTDKTKAGGSIRLTATLSITSGINDGGSATAATEIVIVPTQAKPISNVAVFGKAGTYDISNAVSLYANERADSVDVNDTYTVVYTLASGSSLPSNVTLSGSNIIITSDVTSWYTIGLDAAVTVTSGKYRGKSLTCSTSVKIYDTATKQENKVEFDAAEGAYDSLLAKNMLDGDISSVASVNVYAFDNDDALHVENNGTVNAEIFVDKLFTNTSGGYKDITLGLVITRNDGSEHYAVATLKAAYVNSTATVTFNTQGGSTVASQSVAVGSTAYAPTEPTRENYTFAGWYTDSACTAGKMYDFGVVVVKPFTLYAKWVDCERVISLDRNGVNVTLSSSQIKVINGETYSALSGITPTREGYTFDGWWTASAGGTRVNPDTIVTASVNVLYAHWTGNRITVTLDYGYSAIMGVGNKTATITPTCGSPYLTGDDVKTYLDDTRNRYTLAGWYTAENGGGVCVYSGGEVANVEICHDHTIYAYWRRSNNYYVTLNANGGKINGADTYTAYLEPDSKLTVLSLVPQKSGSIFDGWYTKSAGGTKVDESATITGNVEYYAHWLSPITVSFDVGDASRYGITAPTSISAVNGKAYGTYATIPTLNIYYDGTGHYAFDGWFTAAIGGSRVTSSTTVSASSDHTLYARWNKSITVSFYIGEAKDNGIAVPDPCILLATSDSRYGTLPTMTGYTAGGYTYAFDAWYTEANGGGDQVKAGDSIVSENNHMLFANWLKRITVSFDIGGATADSSITAPSAKTLTLRSGTDYGALDVYTTYTDGVNTYIFDGWYTAASGGVKVESNTEVTSTVDHTLYAKWTKQITVTFDIGDAKNHGVVEPEAAKLKAGSNQKYSDLLSWASSTTYTDGADTYVFDGWYTEANGGGTVITGESAVPTDSSHTIYAKWTVQADS